MSWNAPMTPDADVHRAMPATAGARLAAADRALASLALEQQLAEALRAEIPQARCHHQIRYWRFVRGVLAVSAGEVRA